MKTLPSVIGLFILFIFYPVVGNLEYNDELKEKDIFEYLEETKEALNESVEDLSDDQMQFTPDTESWSVAQVIEHINAVEGGLKGMLENKLTEEEAPEMRAEVQMTDEQIIGFITDRSQKVKTQSQFEPSARFTNADEALEAFNDQREDLVDFLKDVDVDMRNYINEFPFGKIDAYQTVLFLAGHTARHTAQIEEIKQSPGYPEE
jgi:uncharacterized damage-inducible protein DinB